MMFEKLRACPLLRAALPAEGAPFLPLLDPPAGMSHPGAAVFRRTALYRLEHPQCGFLKGKSGEAILTDVLYTPAGRLRQRVNVITGDVLSHYAEKKDHLARLLSLLTAVEVVSLPFSYALRDFEEGDIPVPDWQWGRREVLLQAWVSPRLRSAMEKAPDKTWTACIRELDRIESSIQQLSLEHRDALHWQEDGIYWRGERLLCVPGGEDTSLPELIMPRPSAGDYADLFPETE